MLEDNACILQYLSRQIDDGIRNEVLTIDRRPIQSEYYNCREPCQFYMPKKRVRNIKPDQGLYRKVYKK